MISDICYIYFRETRCNGGVMMNKTTDIIETKNSVVKCDGGEGALGHPAVYLNLGKEEKVVCPYCSRCFIKSFHISSKETKTKGLRRAS